MTTIDTIRPDAHNAGVKPLDERIREEIRKAEAKGTSRAEIARKSGVSKATLTRFLAGDRSCGVEIGERLIQAIGGKIEIRYR